MTATCIINDYRSNRRIYLVFSAVDFDVVNRTWTKKDRLLSDLSSHEIFRNRYAWCDLTPFHFRVLLIENFRYTDALSESDQEDETNTVVRSLHFLIMALIRCLELGGTMDIDMLHVDRVSETQITYRISSTLRTDDFIMSKQKADLRVIVDNTNE